MEETSPQEQPHGNEDEGFGEKAAQFKGIRKRKWGNWVSEIRMLRSRQKLWLGSYTTAQQAARAYDAAVYFLRGPNATFNFPDSIPSIPSASNLSRPEIQLAAESYATLNQYPSTSSGKNNNQDDNANNRNNAREGSASASRSAAVQDSVSLNNSQHQQEDELASVQDSVSLNNSQHQQEDELAFCESLFTVSDNWLAHNMERFPSIGEASALNLVPIRSPSPGLEEGNHEHEEEENQENFQQSTALWKFGDV